MADVEMPHGLTWVAIVQMSHGICLVKNGV